MRRHWIIALLLAAASLALYWPVRQFDLIYFDDPLLLTDCPPVQAGLTWAGVKWALTSVVIANWQPLTNLSFLLVGQFFGIAPGAHHLANALLHAANAALVFLLLRQLTGATWRSAMAAAIFAWHPLRVESVAWIAERKDVLCAFFFLLSLWFYTLFVQARHLREPPSGSAGATARRPRMFYGAALLAFLLALLSKPMAVTLPGVLVLLDLWPLGRLQNAVGRVGQVKTMLVEKVPFFVLMILFCVVTYWIQHDYAAMTPWDKLGAAPRVANAISGYLAYPVQLFYPLHLAAIYPYPKTIDVLPTVLKAGLLLAITSGCLAQLSRRPWLAVGWFWYLGTALPVIGLVQVGEQAMADRYTYLPLIGPVAALVWTAADWLSGRRGGKAMLTVAAIVILCALAALTERQLQFWRNTVALFTHNIAVTPGNSSAWYTLGLGWEHTGDTNRAIVCYRTAKMLEPRDYQNRRNLANLLVKHGLLAAAEAEFQSLVADQPGDCQNRLGLSAAFAAEGRADDALAQLNESVRLDPDCVEALNNLAWTLATSDRAEVRDAPRAVALARHACELTQYHQTLMIGTLAAAQAGAGQFDDAVASAERACAVAAANGETNLLQRNQELLQRYRAGKPAREQ